MAAMELTPVVEPEINEGQRSEAADEYLYLTGRPALHDFLKFVKNHEINPPNDGTLTDEWRTAERVVRRLEKEEAGIADNPPMVKLGKEYEPLLIEFLNDPLI